MDDPQTRTRLETLWEESLTVGKNFSCITGISRYCLTGCCLSAIALTNIEFKAWPKTPRLFRDMTVTEKIDGTNGAIGIRPVALDETVIPGAPSTATDVFLADSGAFKVYAQSRNRLITPTADNAGFAAWVWANAETLTRDLGPGLHYGEWWGKGIQRGYGLDHKRFSLFNTAKWAHADFAMPNLAAVPVLAQHTFDTAPIDSCLEELRDSGSFAAPGFKPAEGVVIYHHAANQVFKALLENDHLHKGSVAA